MSNDEDTRAYAVARLGSAMESRANEIASINMKIPDHRDAEIADLRAKLAESEAEVARLRDANSAFATDAVKPDDLYVAIKRRQRINDLAAEGAIRLMASRTAALDAAVYAGHISGIDAWDIRTSMPAECAQAARALATAVVEAEE